MTQKTYYYRFNKFDNTFWAAVMALILALAFSYYGLCLWELFFLTVLIWGYKHFGIPAVTIMDKDIKIDYSRPIAWKDIQKGEIKEVSLCGQKMKILSLIPKKRITYHYTYMQKHNAHFGPFPIPLYGILSPADELEIVNIVRKKVTVK